MSVTGIFPPAEPAILLLTGLANHWRIWGLMSADSKLEHVLVWTAGLSIIPSSRYKLATRTRHHFLFQMSGSRSDKFLATSHIRTQRLMRSSVLGFTVRQCILGLLRAAVLVTVRQSKIKSCVLVTKHDIKSFWNLKSSIPLKYIQTAFRPAFRSTCSYRWFIQSSYSK